MTMLKTALIGALLAVAPAQAFAATYGETFDEPFAGWETRWFGTLTNAQNYYAVQPSSTPSDIGHRGGNSDGLWLSDGGNYLTDGTANINIRFDATFAASLTSFSMDVVSLLGPSIAARLTFFDKDGATLSSFVLPEGSTTPSYNPIGYINYAVTSANGIGGFDITGYADGNLSVDNIVAVTAAPVPEPAAWTMMIAGVGTIGAAMRRRRTVRFA